MEQENNITQYPRFITFARAEKQLLKNGFKAFEHGLSGVKLFVYDNANAGHRSFIKRIDMNRWEIYTYKLH